MSIRTVFMADQHLFNMSGEKTKIRQEVSRYGRPLPPPHLGAIESMAHLFNLSGEN